MGAVTSLLYGAEDPSIAGMVLDSAFSNLFDLMMELVDVYKIRLPKFTVKVAVQYMRRVIQKKAKFDIMDLNCIQVAPKTFIPALFGHAKDDKFIQPHHSDLISKSYAGDKNIIKFDGDHNSSRPQFFYDSVSIFFYNVLHPPQIPSAYSTNLQKYYDLGDLKASAGMDESLLYEIISGLQTVGTDTASSSSAPPSISATNSVGKFLSEITPVAGVIDSMVNEDRTLNDDDPSQLQDKPSGQNEECCSYASSNRESWGRCSSLGSDDEPSTNCSTAYDNNQVLVVPPLVKFGSAFNKISPKSLVNAIHLQFELFSISKTLKVLATPLRKIQHSSSQSKENKKKQKVSTVAKKPKADKFEKLEALSQRLRLCILKRVSHRRHRSS
ncbi:unnamed protein product [Ilex paraguariensis]